MTESGSFSSLMALVDSHLSKTSMQAGVQAPEENPEIPKLGSWPPRPPPSWIPTLAGASETLSETRLSLGPSQRLPLPTLSLTESPIQAVLAKQVNNMLIAKEKAKLKRERKEAQNTRLAREREKLADEMKKLKLQDDIDLAKAVNEPVFRVPRTPPRRTSTVSSSSSCESLFEPKIIECKAEPDEDKGPEEPLPCKSDMSYMMKEKVKKGRCSPFGKILTSKLRPVASPYLKEKVNTKVVRFDFSTKSPCDTIKDKLKQPRPYTNNKYDLFSIFPDLDT